MDNIVKLPSQQSLFTPTNNLCDLVIPGNSGVYDLSQTYIAFDTSLKTSTWVTLTAGQMGAGSLSQADAVADMRLNFTHGDNSIYNQRACPIELLVRDCSLFSANRGKIEDIRRSDVLRGTRRAYLNDINDVQANALTGTAGFSKTVPWASGAHAQLYGVGSVLSNTRRHELRIYLKDIFNFCNAEAYDSAEYGALSVHLELNLDRLVPTQNLGPGTTFPDTSVWTGRYYHNYPQGGNTPPDTAPTQGPLPTFGKAQNVNSNGATAVSVSSLTMSAIYSSIDDHPFWVGQSLDITTTHDGGGTGARTPADGNIGWAVVSAISWDKDTKLITLEFGGEIASIAVEAGGPNCLAFAVAGSAVIPADESQSAITYDSCELTAVRRVDLNSGPSQIQYTQYQTQADQFANSAGSPATLNRSYFLPPNTTNCIICLPVGGGATNFSDLLGCARLSSYRFTIDGEAVTNRAVPFMTQAAVVADTLDGKGNCGSSIHYDLISKTFMNQGERYHSLLECVNSQIIPPTRTVVSNNIRNLNADPEARCYMLALPIPVKNTQTQLTIELDAWYENANTGSILIYSEIQSVV